MRRYWSVILLGARGVTGKLLALLAVLTAAEAALVAVVGLHTSFLVHMLDSSHMTLAFRIALAALAVICCLWGSDLRGGGRCGYTLARLQVGEMTVVVLWGLCYALAFLALMGFQLLLLLGACGWFAHVNQGFASAQSGVPGGPPEPAVPRPAAYGGLGRLCPQRPLRPGPGHDLLRVVLLAAEECLWHSDLRRGAAVGDLLPASLGGGSSGLVVGILALAVAAVALVFVWKEVRHGTD